MEAIQFEPKNMQTHKRIVCFDELITGLLTSTFFVPVFTGSVNGLTILPLSFLVDNYMWPKSEGKIELRIYKFMSGHNPEMIKEIEFYKSENIEF